MPHIAYIILENNNNIELSNEVMNYSKDGWFPVGGVSITNYVSDGELIWNYAQSMAREPIELHINYFPGRIE